MSISRKLAAAALLVPFAAPSVFAQTDAPRPAPAAEGANLPEFKSVFDKYQPYTEEKVKPWKESNDEVGRIGGWRAYAKEAAAPEAPAPAAAPAPGSAPAAAPASLPASAAGDHSGHHKP